MRTPSANYKRGQRSFRQDLFVLLNVNALKAGKEPLFTCLTVKTDVPFRKKGFQSSAACDKRYHIFTIVRRSDENLAFIALHTTFSHRFPTILTVGKTNSNESLFP